MQVQNTYTPINFEGKVKFKRASLFDRTKLCSFEVPHDTFGTVTVSTERTQKGRYLISVGTKNIKMANESFCVHNDEIYGVSTKTGEPFRMQHLGEITRLASIITMLKNGIKEISIYSVDKATPFHYKYKFKPNITEARPAVMLLKQVECTNLEKFVKQAKNIRAKFKETNNEEELLKATNKLLDEFIGETKTKNKTSPYPFKFWGLDMKLSREEVIKNKDFFNALFEKHDIDYKI